MLPKKAILGAITMARVAQYRMTEMCHMSTQLMFSSGFRLELNVGKARRLIGADRMSQLAAIDRPIKGKGRPDFIGGLFRAKRIIDRCSLLSPATHDGLIAFIAALLRKFLLRKAQSRRIQRKEQHATGGSVESVTGKDRLSKLIADKLEREDPLGSIQGAAMHKQAGRLVDSDIIIVPVKYPQVHPDMQAAASSNDNEDSIKQILVCRPKTSQSSGSRCPQKAPLLFWLLMTTRLISYLYPPYAKRSAARSTGHPMAFLPSKCMRNGATISCSPTTPWSP